MTEPPVLPGGDWPELLPGWVWLCGAGPGDPGLMTLHGLNALRQADVIVHDAGVKHLVRPEDVKQGAAVLDVGVTRETDPDTGTSKVYGDIAPGVEDVAGWLSPNPGGVGPMTVALLMTNVVEAAERTIRA